MKIIALVFLLAVPGYCGPMVPPPTSIGALGLTPAGVARVNQAAHTVALAHLRTCGEGASCPGKTIGGGGGAFSTVSNFLLTVCDAAGLCGGFIVSGRGIQSGFSAPAGGSCTTSTTGGNPQAGVYTSNIDGQNYIDPNSPTGSAWQVVTPYFCSGNFNGFQDAPDAAAEAGGYARVYRRTFTYNTSCEQISGGEFQVLGSMTKPVAGRAYIVFRAKEKNTCAGKVLAERYLESGTPDGYETIDSIVVQSSYTVGDYGGAAANGNALWWNMASPPSEGFDGIGLATGTATYPAPPPPPNEFLGPWAAQSQEARSILENGLTVETTNVFQTGLGTPISRQELQTGGVPASTSTVQTITGTVNVQGTVSIADGDLQTGQTVTARQRQKTFEGEWARVMVKHSTHPFFSIGAKLTGFEAVIGSGTLQGQWCFNLSQMGSHCIDLDGAGLQTAVAALRFFVLATAFIAAVMYVMQ